MIRETVFVLDTLQELISTDLTIFVQDDLFASFSCNTQHLVFEHPFVTITGIFNIF